MKRRQYDAPAYGSKEYWEERYQSHKKLRVHLDTTKTSSESTKDEKETIDTNDLRLPRDSVQEEKKDSLDSKGDKLDKVEAVAGDESEIIELTPPGHAWYFTYDELVPLLIPFLLGQDKGSEDDHEEDNSTINNENLMDDSEEIKNDVKKGDEYSDNETDKISDTNDLPKSNLINPSTNMPYQENDRKVLLEIGCGDVPLGIDFAKEKKLCVVPLQKSTSITNKNEIIQENTIQQKMKEDKNSTQEYSSILRRIICCDYSETCIKFLREKYDQNQQDQRNKQSKNTNDNEKSIDANQIGDSMKSEHEINSQQSKDTKAVKESETSSNHSLNTFDETSHKQYVEVEYEVQDARNLPYKDGEVDVVIDKGTLDAMLSDREKGIANCVEVVAEAGRVLSSRGAMVIISHLNANTMDGLKWLDEVIVPGLRQADSNTDWAIESHGADDPEDTDEECEMEDFEEDSGVNENADKAEGSECVEEETDKKENENSEENDIVDERFGPAVYIIRKNGCTSSNNKDADSNKKNEKNPKTIPFKFFSY